jgi:hypothetical protein
LNPHGNGDNIFLIRGTKITKSFRGKMCQYEQKGEDRAKYGERLIRELADGIEDKEIKGMSFTNLKSFRQFYLLYLI